MPLREPKTPNELLEEFRQNNPKHSKQRATEIIDKCRIVIHYVDGEIRKRSRNGTEDSEDMFALYKARREAIALRLSALSVRNNKLKNFNERVKMMEQQYDTLDSSIKHLTLLVPSPQEG